MELLVGAMASNEASSSHLDSPIRENSVLAENWISEECEFSDIN